MTIVFLISFIGGLLLAVRVMILGVERPREQNPTGERTFRVSPAVIATFAAVFGLSGNLLIRGGLDSTKAAAIAGMLAAVVGVISARLVRKWWTITPEHDVDDERYVLQGHVARVMKGIDGDDDGEVAFEYGSRRHVLRARGLDQACITAGTEVVIERIEGEVAYVEPWLEVEKRL